ncbi:hypothetical protein ADH76_18680 [Enterocloster clostridioformis]|nr:hypothetical protein A4V08_20125 [Lachnoclostridium sp. YL32]NDO27080.1 hypothetical protein [Enterocloster clostridioformis]OXE66044.1 hypothetical protein ADH76_18680 [Enterocloster clostridioformis]QQR03329.1 hypothetical protein I5Q83_14695 [Enterocloster clostridioformis]
MVAHEVFAMISGDTVQNVVVAYNYEEVNRITRCVYGDDAFAVDCLQYPCEIGDKYINGVFYKADGITPIEYIPTQEQQVAQLRRENAELTLALADMIGGAM